MFELCYTSLPKGLAPGSSGYTTVGQSPAMSPRLVKEAENLSIFHFLNEKNPNDYFREPVNFIHWQLNVDKQKVHIVSQIAACQPEHTGRSNYFAHHTMFSPQEALPCKAGPAQLAASPGFFMTKWTGEARSLPLRDLPAISNQDITDHAIKTAGLDLEWGPVLADRLRDRRIKQTYLVYSLGTDMLGIVVDVLSNLRPDERWQATFATHATNTFPPLGVDCQLRCVVADTPYAKELLSKSPKNTFDLSKRPAPPPRRELPIEIDEPSFQPKITGKKSPVVPSPIKTHANSNPIHRPSFDDIVPKFPIDITPRMNGADRHGQFGLRAILIPSALFLMMSIACVLLGYKWIQERNLYKNSNKQVSRLEKKNETLEDEKKEFQKKLKEFQKTIAELNISSEESTEPKPQPQFPDETETETTPLSEKSGNTDIEAGASDTPHSDKQSTDNGPQVHKEVSRELEKYLNTDMKKNKIITLFENVDKTFDFKAEGSFTATSQCDTLLKIKLNFIAKNKADLFQIIGKKQPKFGTINFRDNEISLDMERNNVNAYLARFLTLEIKLKGSQLQVALGAPFKSNLFVTLPDGSEKDDTNLTNAQSYRLFKENEVNDLISKLQTYFGKDNLVASFEFDKSDPSCSYVDPAKIGSRDIAQFAFKTSRAVPKNMIGVGFKNRDGAEYEVSSFLIDPISYTGFDFCEKELKGKAIFTEAQITAMTASYDSEIGSLNKKLMDLNNNLNKKPEPEKGKDQKEINELNAKVAKLLEAKNVDTPAFSEAQKFPLSNLRNIKVRFTLKDPDSNKGFVIVDSLSD